MIPDDVIEDRCSNVQLYEIEGETKSRIFIEAYNRLPEKQPLQGDASQFKVFKMKEICTACSHTYNIGDENYCIRPK